MTFLPPAGRLPNDPRQMARLLEEWRIRLLSATAGVTMVTGTGNPEGVQTAEPGTFFFRTDGTALATLYFKRSGSGSSNWVLIKTEALFNNLQAFDFRDGGMAYSLGTTPANTLFDLKGAGQTVFSLSFWLYQEGTAPNTAVPAQPSCYMSMGSISQGAGSRDMAFMISTRPGVATSTAVAVRTAVSGDNNVGYQIFTTPTVNQFHHWLVVYDGNEAAADRVRVWIDGVSQSMTALFGNSPDAFIETSVKDFVVGAQSDLGFDQQGAIKNFGVYTGTALTGAAAANHYASGDGIELSSSAATGNADLSSYWRFSADAGDTSGTVSDQVGSNDLSGVLGTPLLGVV